MNLQNQEEFPGERRASIRFSIQAPAVATMDAREIWAFTKSISTRAVYLSTGAEEERPSIGEPLNFVIKIPPSMSFSKPCFIRGRGRTVRVDELDPDQIGIVVEILDYAIESQSALVESDDPSKHGF